MLTRGSSTDLWRPRSEHTSASGNPRQSVWSSVACWDLPCSSCSCRWRTCCWSCDCRVPLRLVEVDCTCTWASCCFYTPECGAPLCVWECGVSMCFCCTQSLFERVNKECVRPSSCWFINSSFLFTCSPAKWFTRLFSQRSQPVFQVERRTSCPAPQRAFITVIGRSLQRLRTSEFSTDHTSHRTGFIEGIWHEDTGVGADLDISVSKLMLTLACWVILEKILVFPTLKTLMVNIPYT